MPRRPQQRKSQPERTGANARLRRARLVLHKARDIVCDNSRALLFAALVALPVTMPKQSAADGLFGLVGVPSVDIEGYGWLGDLYLEHTLKVLSTSEEQPEPQINAVFVEDALWIISGQLQQQGYLYPSIGIRMSDAEGAVIYEGKWAGQELTPYLPPSTEAAHVLFSIEPGIRFYFESITIEGLPSDLTSTPASFFYPTDQLLSFKSTRFYNKSRGISGVQGILSRLRAMGYSDADVLDQKVDIDRATGAVHFFAKINHGAIYYAEELVIEPGSLAIATKVLGGVPLFLHLDNNPRLTPEWLQNQIQQVRNRYYEHGYPEVRIIIRYEDVYSPRSTGVEVSTAIDPQDITAAEQARNAAQETTISQTSLTDTDTGKTAYTPDTGSVETATGTDADSAAQQATGPNSSEQQPAPPPAAAPSPQVAQTAPASALEAAAAPVSVSPGAGLNQAAAAAQLQEDINALQPTQPDAIDAVLQPVTATGSTAATVSDITTAGQTNGSTATSAGGGAKPANGAGRSTASSTAKPANGAPAATSAADAIPRPSAVAGGTLDEHSATALAEASGARYQRVIIEVQSGPQVRIGKIGFSGEYGTNMSVLQSQLNIAPGEELDRNRVENTRNKLSSLGIFRSVEIEYTEVDENTWDVTYNMQMKQRTEISLIAGVGTFDIIRGGFLIEQNNLWGLAHNQRLRAVQSFKATDVTYRYGIPQVFGADVDFYAKGSYLYRQEISFNRQEYGAATGLQHFYRPLRTTFDVQYSLEQLSARNRDFVVAPGPTQATVAAITLKASHNGVDNPIFPTKGWQARATAEFAISDLGGQVDYQRLEMAIAYHTPLNESGLIFHTGLRHGVITTGGTAAQDIPVNRRFFMGGENTVRGYRRDQASPQDSAGNQIGAVSYILWQVELEQKLTEDLSFVTFLDAIGNAADISQYPFNETLASIGLGISYNTFVGPLRLEYGYNIKKRPNDPNGTVQFSIGFPF